ncbi:hypothetical protein KKB55_07530, partial [Myxococcota bacterium]|nr:hypothetical protein [Myxococcota bacterium]
MLLHDARFSSAQLLVPESCSPDIKAEPKHESVLPRIKPVSTLDKAKALLGWPQPVEPYLQKIIDLYGVVRDVITGRIDLNVESEAWVPINFILDKEVYQDWKPLLTPGTTTFLTSPAGAGKSTILRLFAAQIAAEELKRRKGQATLPFVVDAYELKDLNDDEALSDYIYKEALALSRFPIPKAAMLGPMALFIDQWDDLDIEQTKPLRERLEGLQKTFGLSLLIATRLYPGYYDPDADRQARLIGPKPQERDEYLSRLSEEVRKKIDARIQGSLRVDEILQNPMFLRWLMDIAQQGKPIPEDRLNILQAATERLLERGIDNISKALQINNDALDAHLQRLGWGFMEAGQKQATWRDASAHLGASDFEAAYLGRIFRDGGLILEARAGVQFAHPAFAERAAAAYVLGLARHAKAPDHEALLAHLAPRLKDLRWSEVVVDAALALPESQEAVFDALLEAALEQPGLLATCLQLGAEGERIDRARKDRLIERVWERFEEHFNHAVPHEAWRAFYRLLEQHIANQQALLGWPSGGRPSADQLAESIKNTPSVVRALAIALGRLGSALVSAGHPTQAVTHHTEEVELVRALASLSASASAQERQHAANARPAPTRELASALGRLGSALESAGHPTQAVTHHTEEVGLVRALASLSASASAQERQHAANARPAPTRELAIALGRLGSALLMAGDPTQAVTHHTEEVELSRALASLSASASAQERQHAANARPA